MSVSVKDLARLKVKQVELHTLTEADRAVVVLVQEIRVRYFC